MTDGTIGAPLISAIMPAPENPFCKPKFTLRVPSRVNANPDSLFERGQTSPDCPAIRRSPIDRKSSGPGGEPADEWHVKGFLFYEKMAIPLEPDLGQDRVGIGDMIRNENKGSGLRKILKSFHTVPKKQSHDIREQRGDNRPGSPANGSFRQISEL